jgi:hypothetical protein
MNEDNFYNSTDAEGFTSCTSEARQTNRQLPNANRQARVTLLRSPDRSGADIVRIREDKLL